MFVCFSQNFKIKFSDIFIWLLFILLFWYYLFIFLPIYLFAFVPISLFLFPTFFLFVFLSIYSFVFLPIYLFFFLPIDLFSSLPIYLFALVPIYLSIYVYIIYLNLREENEDILEEVLANQHQWRLCKAFERLVIEMTGNWFMNLRFDISL